MTSSPCRSSRLAFYFALALTAPAALAAHIAGNWQATAIGVHDGRYVAGGQTYSSLDALEAAVRASRPATLLIVACTPAAVPSWLAVVPHFDDLPMRLDVSDGSSLVCDSRLPVGASGGPASADVEPAVKQYWDRRMP